MPAKFQTKTIKNISLITQDSGKFHYALSIWILVTTNKTLKGIQWKNIPQCFIKLNYATSITFFLFFNVLLFLLE